MNHAIRLLAVVCLGLFGLNPLAQDADPIDLSLLVAEDYPCTWQSGFPMFQLKHYRRIGSLTPYNIDVLTIDGNAGTQIDVPPHSIPRPGSGLPNAGPLGSIFTEKVPAWQFGGEAVVIDVRGLVGTTETGSWPSSPQISVPLVRAYEKAHGPLRAV